MAARLDVLRRPPDQTSVPPFTSPGVAAHHTICIPDRRARQRQGSQFTQPDDRTVQCPHSPSIIAWPRANRKVLCFASGLRPPPRLYELGAVANTGNTSLPVKRAFCPLKSNIACIGRRQQTRSAPASAFTTPCWRCPESLGIHRTNRRPVEDFRTPVDGAGFRQDTGGFINARPCRWSAGAERVASPDTLGNRRAIAQAHPAIVQGGICVASNSCFLRRAPNTSIPCISVCVMTACGPYRDPRCHA